MPAQLLNLNPYHFGAIFGMAPASSRSTAQADALKSFRRGLKIQPYSETLRANIKLATAQLELDASH